MSHFTVEERGEVTLITLDNPPYNTVNGDLMREGTRMLEELTASGKARSVVLTGAGDNYSRGMDVKIAAALTEQGRIDTRDAINRFIAALHRLPCPLVSAVSGHVIGAGGIMTLVSDWVVAAAGDYKIGLPEAKAGLAFPTVPQAVLDHWLDPVWRRRLALTSVLLPPSEAIPAGLVDEVVAPEDVLETALTRASEMAAQPAFADCKRQLRANANAEIDAILGE